MCTAITLQSLQKNNFIGRTLGFSYPLEPHFFYVPKNLDGKMW